MCLLFVLYEIAKTLPMTLSVVHVEHGIRGEESKADARFVQKICEELSIPCHEVSIDCIGYAKEQGLTVEEAGRIKRYEAFYAENPDKIAIAHHKNDTAETLLFNLFRGTGIKGLGGIAPVRDCIIRPLLCVTREEIEQYLAEKKKSFCIDSTNQSHDYSRNRIRLNILPEAVQINGQAVSHMSDTAEIIRQADEYLTRVSDNMYERYVKTEEQGRVVISGRLFHEQAEIIVTYVLKRCLSEIAGKWKDMTSVHLKHMAELFNKQSGRSLSLPYGILVKREYDTLVINKILTDSFKSIEVPEAGNIILPDGRTLITTVKEYEKNDVIPDELYTKWFDYDKIKNIVLLRTRQAGDYLYVNKEHGTQKLKSYFINEKVPQSMRDKTLLLADGSHILWVIGHRISEETKVTEQTKRIWKVEIRKGEEK